jgi:hypothetical protein
MLLMMMMKKRATEERISGMLTSCARNSHAGRGSKLIRASSTFAVRAYYTYVLVDDKLFTLWTF